MIKEALQYLVGLKDNKTYEIHGDTYSDKELVRVVPHVDRPKSVEVNGLDSVVKLVRTELDMFSNLPVYIRVVSARQVDVFTTLDEYMGRDSICKAVCDAPAFNKTWMSHDEAIIALRSQFLETEGSIYLLDLLGRINVGSEVSSEDNGVSQTVSARSGVSLKQNVVVKPIVNLQPYRTFTEVQQPESDFLLRLDQDGNVGLIEADGGAWRMVAKDHIKRFFETKLKDEIEAGKVVVMR